MARRLLGDADLPADLEGKRLMPVNRGQHGIQRRDPKLYEPITDADAEVICYPPGTGRARPDKRISDARAALEKLVRAVTLWRSTAARCPRSRGGTRA